MILILLQVKNTGIQIVSSKTNTLSLEDYSRKYVHSLIKSELFVNMVVSFVDVKNICPKNKYMYIYH